MSGTNEKVWTLIDRTVIASAVQTYDFAPTIAVSGNVDLAYWIVGFVKNDNAGTAEIGLRLNTAAIACDRQRFNASSTTLTAARDTTTTFASVPTTKSVSFCCWMLKTATGDIRHAIISSALDSSTSIQYENYAVSITTPATSANITSVGIGSSVTSGLGVGTELNLFTLR